MCLSVFAGVWFYTTHVFYGPYVKNMRRHYDNALEKDLIATAEEFSPPDGRWWCDEFDNIKIADCVTLQAIQYYATLIENIRRDHDYTGISIKHANFTYVAEVHNITNKGTYNTSDTTLYEVNLTTHFDEYCGNVCAMHFTHTRSVIFNQRQEVLAVKGDDNPPPVIVS